MKVLFFGNFIPLQGVQYIIKAAKILEKEPDIKFEIIGNGQTHGEMIDLAKNLRTSNIIFIEKLPITGIAEHIRNADICLGIFGNTRKTQMVIPNKVYEAIAMVKPVITADTPAIRELFKDGESIVLCKEANPEDLAAKILELRANSNLRNSIAQKGYELFKEFATSQKIGQELIKNLD